MQAGDLRKAGDRKSGQVHICSSGCCCWSAKEVRPPDVVDAAESMELPPEMLCSSILCPSASYGTQLCMPADCAATLASRRVDQLLDCLPLWKLNHEFQWLAMEKEMGEPAMHNHRSHPQSSLRIHEYTSESTIHTLASISMQRFVSRAFSYWRS